MASIYEPLLVERLASPVAAITAELCTSRTKTRKPRDRQTVFDVDEITLEFGSMLSQAPASHAFRREA
jgi:hypothetical protein